MCASYRSRFIDSSLIIDSSVPQPKVLSQRANGAPNETMPTCIVWEMVLSSHFFYSIPIIAILPKMRKQVYVAALQDDCSFANQAVSNEITAKQ